ncbi:hypothetical protein IJO12_03930, partial [bacterium]|nr:hypothetical protein [bacterium]
EFSDDVELIFSKHYTHFIWGGDETPDSTQYCWSNDDSQIPVWPINSNSLEKAEICGSNYSVQICVQGRELTDNCAIIGLQFREIYDDETN